MSQLVRSLGNIQKSISSNLHLYSSFFLLSIPRFFYDHISPKIPPSFSSSHPSFIHSSQPFVSSSFSPILLSIIFLPPFLSLSIPPTFLPASLSPSIFLVISSLSFLLSFLHLLLSIFFLPFIFPSLSSLLLFQALPSFLPSLNPFSPLLFPSSLTLSFYPYSA